jgi:hypothetical protein
MGQAFSLLRDYARARNLRLSALAIPRATSGRIAVVRARRTASQWAVTRGGRWPWRCGAEHTSAIVAPGTAQRDGSAA